MCYCIPNQLGFSKTCLRCLELTAFERTQQAQAFCRVLGRLLEDDPSCKDMYDIIYFKGIKLKLCNVSPHLINLFRSFSLKIKTQT